MDKITLPVKPYWENAEAYFYERKCNEYTCIIRRSSRYYREFYDWLKDEYSAELLVRPNQLIRVVQFENEKHRTLFALRWS